jgi:putative heme-binding domain-containing protein
MKPGLFTSACLTIWLALSAGGVNGQTLTEKLIADDPARLADEARSHGNIIRGAILFHQGNINCAKCHRPSAERDRIGPDLSRMEPETTDAQLIESILQPSKTIKKGFETTILLGVDGQIHQGIILHEDAEKVVFRNSQNVDQTLTRHDVQHAGKSRQRTGRSPAIS